MKALNKPNPAKLFSNCMGEDRANQVYEFFKDILNYVNKSGDTPVIVISLTKRMDSLIHTYIEIAKYSLETADIPEEFKSMGPEDLNKIIGILEKSTIGADSIKTLAYEMISDALDTGVVPKILIVDAVKVYGRTLNHFMYTLEETLKNVYINLNIGATFGFEMGQFIEYIMQDNLDIMILSRELKNYMVLPRYSEILNRYEPKNTDCKNDMQVYDLWMVRNNFAVCYAETATEPKEFNMEFQKVETTLKNVKQTEYIALKDSNVYAIYSMQRTSELSETMCYTPIILTDGLNREIHIKFHKKLIENAKHGKKDKAFELLTRVDRLAEFGNDAKFSWTIRTNKLAVELATLKNFLDSTHIEYTVNWERIARDFKKFENGSLQSDDTIDSIKELWDIVRFSEVKESLQGSRIIKASFDYNVSTEKEVMDESSQMVQHIEDVLFKLGFEAIINAKTVCNSGLALSDVAYDNWGCYHSIGTILDILQAKHTINTYKALGVIIHEIATGVIRVEQMEAKHPIHERNIQRYTEVYDVLKVGVSGVLLMAYRYRNLWSVLYSIQERRAADMKGVELDLEELADEVIKACGTDKIVPISYQISLARDEFIDKVLKYYKTMQNGRESIKSWKSSYLNNIAKDNIKMDRYLSQVMLYTYNNV